MTTEPIDGELKYLAGLFEGEGTVYIGKYKSPESKTGYNYQVHLSVTMTDYEPINTLRDYFGGSIRLHKGSKSANGRDGYRWETYCKSADAVAKQLIPHILTPRKRGALQCAIDFAETVIPGRHPLSPEIIRKRDELYRKCRAYNARGRNANNRSEEALVEIEAIKIKTAQMLLWA